MKSINLLKTRLDCLDKNELKDFLLTSLVGKNKIKIGKINTEFLLRSIKNNEFEKAINDFNLNIADGSGVLWSAKYLSLPLSSVTVVRQIQAIWQMIYTGASLIFNPNYCLDVVPERFPGVEALFMMLEIAENNQVPVYFLGAEKEVSMKLPAKIKEKFPRIIIAGHHEGYDFKDEEIIEEINRSGAKLLIVAFGSPRQEYWIRDNIDKIASIRVAVGEGGSFDFIVGENKRSPRWMRKTGLEWFWRLFVNSNKTGDPDDRPKRRYGRVWQAVPVFIYNVVKYKLETSGK